LRRADGDYTSTETLEIRYSRKHHREDQDNGEDGEQNLRRPVLGVFHGFGLFFVFYGFSIHFVLA
jgi:hypothetical protein